MLYWPTSNMWILELYQDHEISWQPYYHGQFILKIYLTGPYILKIFILMYELLHVRAGTWDEHLSIDKLPVQWPNQILIMLLYACSHVYLKPTLHVYVCSASACALYNYGVHLVMVIWIYTDIHIYILYALSSILYGHI